MIKQYFKQAWNLIRQEKLFSSVYIIGTGLSIMVVMVLSIIFYVKIANVYPETNRDRLLIAKRAVERQGDGMSASHLSFHTIETCFQSLKSAETTSLVYMAYGNQYYVQPQNSREQLKIGVKYTDTNFWKIFPFRFVDGKPFSEADMQSGVHTAVIAESLAKRLFGRPDVTGEYINMNFRPYRISGVVKDASYVTANTYSHLWIPYTVIPDYKKHFGQGGSLGSFEAYILAPSAREVETVRREAHDNLQRYAQELKATENIEFSTNGQPERQIQNVLRGAQSDFDFRKTLMMYAVIFFILLLVPAVSLSGMTESRMERRLAEMGVRHAFGACNSTLVWQILSENLLFTLLGGVIGLLFSYLTILLGGNWLILLGNGNMAPVPQGVEVFFTPAMLLNLNVFGIALFICLLLNILSALIPAWRMSRREIVYSLNTDN